MAKTATERKIIYRVYMHLSVAVAAVLLAAGGLAWWAHTYTTTMVRKELAAQKIYFPDKGSPALDPATYPDLQQYAGQLVDTPEEARAYANGYIGRHLHAVAGGKVYAEVSAEARQDPKNQKLQQQRQTLFQGETLRGILLTSGFGIGTAGRIAGIAAMAALAGAALMLLAAVAFRRKLR